MWEWRGALNRRFPPVFTFTPATQPRPALGRARFRYRVALGRATGLALSALHPANSAFERA